MAGKKRSAVSIGIVDSASMPLFTDFLGDDVKGVMAEGISVAVIGAVDGDTAVGAISGYVDQEQCFNVLSLYVAPDYRKIGIGKSLLDSVRKAAAAMGDIPVRLAFCSGTDEADTLLGFMKALGYKETDVGERLHRFTVGDFKNKTYFPPKYKDPCLHSFEELSNEEIKRIAVRTAERHRDMPEDGFTSSRVYRDCSFAYVKNGILKGYLVCDDTSGGELTVSAIFAKDKFAMAGLLRSFASAMKARHKASDVIVMPVPTDRFDGLFDTLFPGVVNLEHNYLIR